MINWWNTELAEAEKTEMLRAFSERRFTTSRSVERAEELFSQLLNVPYVVMTNSGSSALLMALLSLNLKPDDEVIVPAITWIATAQAPALLNLKVRICDCEANSPIMDPDHLKKLITKKTKVIMPVHLNGRHCDLDRIQELASLSGAYVLEDACKALFSKGAKGYLGTIGEIGCFSLGMISPVSVGYGGLVVTKQKDLYLKLKKIRDHGVQRQPEIYEHLGFNFKISDILASLAIPQLLNIEEKKQKFLAIHDFYSEKICNPHIQILPSDKKGGSLPIYVEAASPQREELIAYLQKKEIQVSRYHLPTYHASYLHPEGSFPNAKRFAEECFILPSGPAQNLDDIQKVVEQVNQFNAYCTV